MGGVFFFFFGLGKNFLHWPGARAELVVSEPELIKELLYDNEQSFCRSDADRYLKKILGKGILTSDGEKWLKLRQLSSQAFHAESLRVRACNLQYIGLDI